MWVVDPVQIAGAVALDLALGDPRGWPHIARAAGELAKLYEPLATERHGRTVMSGVFFWLLVCFTMLVGYWAAYIACVMLWPPAGRLLGALVIYQAIASTDLRKHVKQVLAPLAAGDLAAAREKLSMIVGRDTAALDEAGISRAAIEAGAESLTDGVIAPLFWAVVLGPQGALIYRAANTLDSMVGHRDERYEQFGKASARIDDALNWIPARFAALCIVLAAKFIPPKRDGADETVKPRFDFRALLREARQHASPNAGWTEAAMAQALDVQLGGENSYDGVPTPGPVFNEPGRTPDTRDVAASMEITWKTSAIALAVLLACLLALHQHVFPIPFPF